MPAQKNCLLNLINVSDRNVSFQISYNADVILIFFND